MLLLLIQKCSQTSNPQIYLYVCMCVCMHVCMYVCIYRLLPLLPIYPSQHALPDDNHMDIGGTGWKECLDKCRDLEQNHKDEISCVTMSIAYLQGIVNVHSDLLKKASYDE